MSTTTSPMNQRDMQKRVRQMVDIQREGLDLFRRKNADYGDAFATYGAIGVLIRMGDKIKRLMSISATEVRMVDDESMYDTLLDLHNYAAMALMLLKEKKTLTTPTVNRAESNDCAVCDFVCCCAGSDGNPTGWCGDGALDG